jgi:hypothetical protein
MLTVTIASTAGTATINDTGTSGYVLISFAPARVVRQNALAESQWLDGAIPVSSRTEVASISAAVRVFGTTTAHVMASAAALGTIVNELDYTVGVAYTGGGSVTYSAMPASYYLEYDPNLLRANQAVMTLDIPVQP